MTELQHFDRRFVAERLPRDIRNLLKIYAGQLYVGGGFIRAVIGREEVNDIDLFGADPEAVANIAGALQALRPGSKQHISQNAITLLTPDRLPVQFITRWTFRDADALIKSFDFTVCQAVLWRRSNGTWVTRIGDRFYIDLAGKRLFYTSPVRAEDVGGSLLRVLKYVRRGYSIQVDSLGRVIARLASQVRGEPDEAKAGLVFSGLLREVDPLLVIDGLEVVDDHMSEEAQNA